MRTFPLHDENPATTLADALPGAVVPNGDQRPRETDARVWMATYNRALAIVSRKWVVGIVRALEHGPRRQYQLRMANSGIQLKVLRDTLRTLEGEGLVEQIIVREHTGTGVGWALTPTGRGLIGPITAIFEWGHEHLEMPAAAVADVAG
jgi:DNA-binding HxlR family transcriptional regulator